MVALLLARQLWLSVLVGASPQFAPTQGCLFCLMVFECWMCFRSIDGCGDFWYWLAATPTVLVVHILQGLEVFHHFFVLGLCFSFMFLGCPFSLSNLQCSLIANPVLGTRFLRFTPLPPPLQKFSTLSPSCSTFKTVTNIASSSHSSSVSSSYACASRSRRCACKHASGYREMLCKGEIFQ